MKLALLALLTALACAAQNPAASVDPPKRPHHQLFHVSLVFVTAASAADAGSSIACSRDPRLHEVNPLGLDGVLAVKAIVAPLLIWVEQRDVKRGRRERLWTIYNLTLASGYGFLAWHNTKELSR